MSENDEASKSEASKSDGDSVSKPDGSSVRAIGVLRVHSDPKKCIIKIQCCCGKTVNVNQVRAKMLVSEGICKCPPNIEDRKIVYYNRLSDDQKHIVSIIDAVLKDKGERRELQNIKEICHYYIRIYGLDKKDFAVLQ